MSFIENIGFVLLGFVVIVAVFLIILTFLEKKLHIRFMQGKYWKNQIYIMKLSKISLDNLEPSLRILDKLAKNFFREAFHIKSSPEYSELETFFQKKNNKKGAEFSSKMTKFMYSGTKITKPDLQSLIILLAELIGANKIITKQEKVELDKKSKVKEPLLGKVKILGIGKKKFKQN